MQSYQTLSAQVYQLDKPIGCSFGDVEYYAARLSGVVGKILEPAVGKRYISNFNFTPYIL